MAEPHPILKLDQNALLGIDGCKVGWCVVFKANQSITCRVITHLEELDTSRIKRCLIDMPIGLHPLRQIDAELRNRLKPHRHHSVFSVPVREAVYAPNYEQAKKEHIKACGKSISIQSWNICNKIKSLDLFIQKTNSENCFEESHPEYCFYLLNKATHLQHKKSTKEGQAERLKILLEYTKDAHVCFETALKNYKRSELKADDILDALVLFVTNTLPLGFIANEPSHDSKGIPMRIAFPNVFG